GPTRVDTFLNQQMMGMFGSKSHQSLPLILEWGSLVRSKPHSCIDRSFDLPVQIFGYGNRVPRSSCVDPTTLNRHWISAATVAGWTLWVERGEGGFDSSQKPSYVCDFYREGMRGKRIFPYLGLITSNLRDNHFNS